MPALDTLLLVNTAIAITVLETLALLAWRATTGRGPAPPDVLANIAAGLCLMLALRSVLAGAGWTGCALWLSAAGAAHATDLWRRWPRRHLSPP